MSDAIDPNVRPSPAIHIAGFQTAISLGVLALLLSLFASADFASRSAAVSDFFSRRELVANGDHGAYHLRRGIFFDENDYFWYRVADPADFSRGGVYVFGASTTNYSFDAASLPKPLCDLVHNFGYSGARPGQAADVIDYFIHRRGILAAGAAKNMFIVGFCFFDVEPGVFAGVFPESLARTGERAYDAQTGIVDLNLSPIDRFVGNERARARSVALRLILGQRTGAGGPVNADLFRAHVMDRIGSHWDQDLQIQISRVNELLDELKTLNVQTRGVLLPLGSWCDGIPLRVDFENQLRAVFAAHDVPLIDCTRAVPDDGFRDPYHLNSRGAAVIQNVFLDPARQFISRENLSPAP